MDKEFIEKFLDKNVIMNLKDGYFYTCIILSVGNSTVEIKDKYGEKIIIDFDSIAKIRGVDS